MVSGKFKPKMRGRGPHLLPNLLIFGLLRRPRNAADFIHRSYVIYYWRQCRSKRDLLSVFKGFLLSPLRIARDISAWSGRLGPAVAAVGKPMLRQRLEQFYLAFFFSINSECYYLQEFYRVGGLERARLHVNKKALKAGVYRLLGTYGRHLHREAEICSLGRKLEFYRFCRHRGLKAVPVLMQFMGDGTVYDFRRNPGDQEELPKIDLFCKPNLDNRGRGAEVWFWKEREQCYVSPDGESLTARALGNRLTTLARQHRYKSYIVQPLVLPHPDLEPFRKQATPTVRIITYTDLTGTNRIDRAMLRFSPNPATVVDNASAGGMVAPIDVEMGLLGEATSGDVERVGCRERHLDNGVQIKGRPIPCWEESLKLVLQAHECFPQRLVIGWDVLITREGPLLLEGNSQPGVCFIQKAHLESLGEMDSGKAMAAHCKNALDVLYSGWLDGGCDDRGIDLFNGSRLKRWLSWLPASNIKTVHLVISGKVQRVFYRRWLQTEAREKKLAGWVRNRFDGTVEAVLKGRAFDIEDVVRSAWFGPPGARVSSIQINWHKGASGGGFRILKNVKSGSGDHGKD